jgi:hypothetical protein
MNTRIAAALTFLVLLVRTAAAWEPDTRLTDDGGISWTSYTSARCLAAGPGGGLYAVWFDDRDGNYEIYTKRSTDHGTTWEADTRLTDDAADQYHPAVAVADTIVHVVWWDERNGLNSEIYYRRSTDAGATWLEDARLTDNSAKSHFPSIAAAGDTVHVVWWDERTGWDIYYKRSTDAGATWSDDIPLTATPGLSMWPSVAVSQGSVHVVWFDDRDGNQEIYYKRSTDGGATWEADTRLTTADFYSEYPVVAAAGPFVHAAWSDNRDGNYEAYYKRSTDGGATWEADVRLSSADRSSTAMSLAVLGARVHLFWADNREWYWPEVFHRSSGDNGLTWDADERLTFDNQPSDRPTGCAWDSLVAVLWEDGRDGNWEIYFKRDTLHATGLASIPAGRLEPVACRLEPNPSSDGFTAIRWAGAGSRPLSVRIHDAAGRLLACRQVEHSGGRLDLRGLKTGIYFVDVSTGDGHASAKLTVRR